jgi:hypothetical protein
LADLQLVRGMVVMVEFIQEQPVQPVPAVVPLGPHQLRRTKLSLALEFHQLSQVRMLYTEKVEAPTT